MKKDVIMLHFKTNELFSWARLYKNMKDYGGLSAIALAMRYGGRFHSVMVFLVLISTFFPDLSIIG